MKKKSLQKILVSLFCVGQLPQACSHPVVWLIYPGRVHWQKLFFPLFVGFTLRITFWVVMGPHVHFPLLGLWPHLVLCLLVWSVNSYVHSSSCVWETVFPCSYHHLCLLHVTRVALLFTTEFWLYLQTS